MSIFLISFPSLFKKASSPSFRNLGAGIEVRSSFDLMFDLLLPPLQAAISILVASNKVNAVCFTLVFIKFYSNLSIANAFFL
ncbi:hypothetical protein D3C78_1514350 [compost metagenome]